MDNLLMCFWLACALSDVLVEALGNNWGTHNTHMETLIKTKLFFFLLFGQACVGTLSTDCQVKSQKIYFLPNNILKNRKEKKVL